MCNDYAHTDTQLPDWADDVVPPIDLFDEEEEEDEGYEIPKWRTSNA